MRDSNFARIQLSVVLVHPSPLFAEGLASLLKDTHYNIIHQLTGFESAYFSGGLLEGKVVFIVGGRTSSGIAEIVKNIRSQLSSAYILVINASTGPSDVMVALQAGADGYLRDAISSQTLIRVIELIVEDESVLPPEFVKSLRESRDAPPEVISAGGHDTGDTSKSTAASAQTQTEDSAKGCTSFRKSLPEQRDGGMLRHCVCNVCQSLSIRNGENSANAKLSAREGSILRGLVDGAPNKMIAQRLHITEATVKVHVKGILRKIRVKNRTQAAIWGSKHLPFSEALMDGQENPLRTQPH